MQFVGVVLGAEIDDGAGRRRHAEPLAADRCRDAKLKGNDALARAAVAGEQSDLTRSGRHTMLRKGGTGGRGDYNLFKAELEMLDETRQSGAIGRAGRRASTRVFVTPAMREGGGEILFDCRDPVCWQALAERVYTAMESLDGGPSSETLSRRRAISPPRHTA